MKIDAHQHFWRYDPREYGWISGEMSVIRRDFLAIDFFTEMVGAGLDGAVSVQARQSMQETAWLLELAERYDFIRGVVGWVDLRADGVSDDLSQLASRRKFKAVRHVVQDEPDEEYLARPEFNRGVSALQRHSLAYDILIFERQLPQAIAFVDRHPGQVFVLDHLAKPSIRAGEIDIWARHLAELGRRPNVYAKVSGLVTEANPRTWTPEQLRPYFERALDVFGPRRLMFGTDWPVCLVGSTYRKWYDTVVQWVARLSPSEQARIFGETAVEAYRL